MSSILPAVVAGERHERALRDAVRAAESSGRQLARMNVLVDASAVPTQDALNFCHGEPVGRDVAEASGMVRVAISLPVRNVMRTGEARNSEAARVRTSNERRTTLRPAVASEPSQGGASRRA